MRWAIARPEALRTGVGSESCKSCVREVPGFRASPPLAYGTHQAMAMLKRGLACILSGAVFPALRIQLSLPVKHNPCILHPQKVTPPILEILARVRSAISFFLSLLQLVSGSSRTQPRCSPSQEAYPDPTPILSWIPLIPTSNFS